MTTAPVALGKSALPEKAGVGTPTALLGTKSMIQYTLQAHQSNRSDCPACGREFDSPKAIGPHFRARHPDCHAVLERIRRDFRPDAKTTLRALHHTLGIRVEEIADRFDYPRDGLIDAFDEVGVERREWELADWYDEEPEQAGEHARRVASLGAPAREENGMAGVTGQDHPKWRGGKSIYDAVKKQLPGDSWRQKKVEAKERDDNTCQMCGASECKLDSHHIVPIMAGGTNEFWNLITLCESCHTAVEQHTHAISPVWSPC